MDTTEQINGYFYGGFSNLSPGELFFWIAVDTTAEHFVGPVSSPTNLAAAALLLAGDNNIYVPGKLGGATFGTSRASLWARKYIKDFTLPRPIPTLVGGPNPFKVKVRTTNNLAAAIGRMVPVVGWAIVASDISLIIWKTMNKYNRIAKEEDKVW
ncbi:hypothetical protein IRM71_02845 [Erwinia amylovora]|uniref:STM2901 family protein n=1 Tax=Erwinia amylovora TaxID=552 RepID=UPI001D072912|nr:hypothetical protein [Erwinia amylovora]UDJ86334.1 hypothetical protein IRM68_15045 [Erwinia amylovora]UDJ97794.1 hypothetical protein IRM69_10975 [Erwinia amylovora]UDK90147.1 hypothetical protein IRM70_02850 [Erwinia amylovora]UDK93538.1 hypothetical protein IRM71_02845 [Erwinia amylovora]UOD74373.1 hypothetical protein IRM67_15545 [Erwinia amylovora]